VTAPLGEAVAAARAFAGEVLPDDRERRHAEARFLERLEDAWSGLRQGAATEAQLAIRMADAGLGLGHDDEALMMEIIETYLYAAAPSAHWPMRFEYEPTNSWVAQVRTLRESGQLAQLHREARSVLELPLTELARGDSSRADSCWRNSTIM